MKIPRIIALNPAGAGHYSKFNEMTRGPAPLGFETAFHPCVRSAEYPAAAFACVPLLPLPPRSPALFLVARLKARRRIPRTRKFHRGGYAGRRTVQIPELYFERSPDNDNCPAV